MTVPDKEYTDMTNDELAAARDEWEAYCKDAAGWASAYFAATQLDAIVWIANERGLGFVNKYPIKRG